MLRTAAVLSLLTWLALVTNANAADRPNVLVIYSDDQGTIDAGCYGADDLITPHIDQLAKSGLRLTQMYAPSAICSASRAGLLTGRFPVRAGVPGNVSSTEGAPGMPTEEITLAEIFRDAGYATGHVGKWHLGYTPETMPNGQGFDQSFGHMGGCIDNYSHYFYWNGPNRHDLWRNGEHIWQDGSYFPDLTADECERFIADHKDEPFFLYCAFNIPHYPLQATEPWRKRYAGVDPPRSMYGALVSTMDERIGRVLASLDRHGVRENTIVIFQSDHGHSTEERTFGGGGSAGTYRGAKGCLFEGGIRVPSIIAWPRGLPAGEVRDQFATGCDWLPTLADLCGLPEPRQHLDGRSLRAVLTENAATPHESFYWQLGDGRRAQWVVRQGSWKLLGNPKDTSQTAPLDEDDTLFLANLEQDPGERKNLAEKHPEVVRRLEALRDEYLQSLDDRDRVRK